MKIINSVAEYKDFLGASNKKQTGFVPTMGALHQGHLSLVRKSLSENDLTVVSIFVNPKQFNDKNDFEKYPRTLEKDLELLKNEKCDIVFVPQTDDIYNNYTGIKIDFKELDKIYEGKFRPGHFQGVVDIVYRLFEIVKPDKAYFGEKDFQQLAIIKLMVKQTNLPIIIVPCEIVREKSGLAMSSRNERLTAEQREIASFIYKTMLIIKENAKSGDNPQTWINFFQTEINKHTPLKYEYATFCEPNTLNSVSVFEKNKGVQLCVAVWCDEVRLIDNLFLQF
jgi:pantoate--beta-alanine ligase